MAPRVSWKGFLKIGLVMAPVGLVSAITEKEVKFSQFTADGHPVGRKTYDKITGEDVARRAAACGFLPLT
jgi:non-homologous end joining protein Ku